MRLPELRSGTVVKALVVCAALFRRGCHSNTSRDGSPKMLPSGSEGTSKNGVDGKVAIGNHREEAAVKSLAARLPAILKEAGWKRGNLWNVPLRRPSVERSSLLAAFLRAREWNVQDATTMLIETLRWRRENDVDNLIGPDEETSPAYVADDRIFSRMEPSGPITYVVVRMGRVGKEAFYSASEYVRWRVRMQERACAHLGLTGPNGSPNHWRRQPRGPTYTLVLDASGLRPFHFGKHSRESLAELTRVMQSFYPDFVQDTIVINAPGFVVPMWGLISRMLPSWWVLKVSNLRDIEQSDGGAGASTAESESSDSESGSGSELDSDSETGDCSDSDGLFKRRRWWR